MDRQRTLDLYVDDSGSRHPDRKDNVIRRDGVDAFALGGILVESERAPAVFDLHQALTRQFGIDYPLHSHSIRTRTRNFAWLGKSVEREREFHEAIAGLIAAMPAVVIACVVDRPGYNARYGAQYGEDRWQLCKSAYAILLERAAKRAIEIGRRLRVYVEGSGKDADRAIKAYHRTLHESGMYFDAGRSAPYEPLGLEALKAAIFKNPSFVTKHNPFAQVADLVLFPVVKGGYDGNYRPYRHLVEQQKLIDCHLAGDPAKSGIKYYCFDHYSKPGSRLESAWPGGPAPDA